MAQTLPPRTLGSAPARGSAPAGADVDGAHAERALQTARPRGRGGPISRTALLAGALVVAAALAPLALPWLKTPVVLALCNGLAVLGVIVLVRAGQVSFGHAMYFCVGGYAVAFGERLWKLDALLLLPLGTLAATLLGVVIGLFVVRYRGIFFGMLNLAFSMMLFAVLAKFGALTGGTDGLRFDRPRVAGVALDRDAFETVLLFAVLAAAAFCGWLVMRYFGSVGGQQLAAIKTNETRLEYLGISARRVFFGGYLLSTALAGLGGSLFALAQGLITPEVGYWVRSGEFVFIAILGGAGHAVGAFIGAFVFEFTKLYAAALLTGAWQLALGVVLLVIVFAAPGGLFGLAARWLKPTRP